MCELGKDGKLAGTYCLGERQWMTATESTLHPSSGCAQFRKAPVLLLLDGDLADQLDSSWFSLPQNRHLIPAYFGPHTAGWVVALFF